MCFVEGKCGWHYQKHILISYAVGTYFIIWQHIYPHCIAYKRIAAAYVMPILFTDYRHHTWKIFFVHLGKYEKKSSFGNGVTKPQFIAMGSGYPFVA